MNHRITHQPGFVLHRRPWSESSFVVELVTADYGRVGVLAKGARRLKSPYRGLLEPFQELQVGWSGKGELPVLTGAEFRTRQSALSGTLVYSGFYLNELLLRLLVRRDPSSDIYQCYANTLTHLRDPDQRTDSVLRKFELALLGYLGYGLVLENEAHTDARITAEALYNYVVDLGPVLREGVQHGEGEAQALSTVTRPPDHANARAQDSSGHPANQHWGAFDDGGRLYDTTDRGVSAVPVSGRTLLCMRDGDFSDRQVLSESKRLLREQLRQVLDGKSLQSRHLLHGVRRHLAHYRGNDSATTPKAS